MKIMLFFMLVSHSLSVDKFPQLAQPKHTLQKGCPNAPNLMNSSPDQQYCNSDGEEGDTSEDCGSKKYFRNFNGAETTGEPIGKNSPPDSDNSTSALNPHLPTPKVENQGSCGGITDTHPKWSIGSGQVSSESGCDSAVTTDFSPESESCTVVGNSEAGPYPNIPSANSQYSVSQKYLDGGVSSNAPSSGHAGLSLPMCPVTAGKYCPPRSSFRSKNYWVPVSSEVCVPECAASGPVIDESLRNFVTAVHSLQTLLPVFADNFGDLQKLRSSLTRERSQSSLGLLLNIRDDLRVMAKLKDTVAPEKFQGNARWMKLLKAITDLTENFGVYLSEIHNVEGSHTRVNFLNIILGPLRRELVDLLEWTLPVVNYFQDLLRMDD